jgi:hypothetical protein
MTPSDLYDYDLFISYAQIDNGAVGSRRVTAIVKRIEGHLIYHLGWRRPPRIFFDQFVGEMNAKQEQDLLEAVRRSAVFLAIGSPNYVVREWTLKELEAFAALPDAEGRLFCAELLPPSKGVTAWPSPLRRLLRIPFWQLDPDSKMAAEFNRSSKPYNRAIALVGQRIFDQLRSMAQDPDANAVQTGQPPSAEPTSRAPAQPGRSVVVALAGDDMHGKVDELAASLALGADPVRVLPAKPYPQDQARFRTEFEEDLNNAAVFVQLLGVDAPAGPAGFRDGVAQYQLDVAKARGKTILQWRLHDLVLKDIADDDYRDLVAESSCPVRGFEDFKARVRAVASHEEAPQEAAATVFIYAPRDRLPQAEEIGRLFETHEFTVALPKGESRGEIRAHRDRMFGEAEVLMFVPDADPDTTVWVSEHLRLFDERDRKHDPKALGVCALAQAATAVGEATVTTVRPRHDGDDVEPKPIVDFIRGLRA